MLSNVRNMLKKKLEGWARNVVLGGGQKDVFMNWVRSSVLEGKRSTSYRSSLLTVGATCQQPERLSNDKSLADCVTICVRF